MSSHLTCSVIGIGQHNDSRMNMALIMTAVQHGAVVANHVEVIELIKDGQGQVRATKMRDVLTGEEWTVAAKVKLLFAILSSI